MRIAVYGGSFNPPHLGHEEVAKTVLHELEPDLFLVIPDYLPPHKEMAEESPTPEQRLEMCRLAFQDIPGTEISDMEIMRGGKSYTSDTLSRLKEKYPGADIYLIIGSDMLLSFTTWHEYQYILDNCTLAVVTRTGDDIEELKKALFNNSVLLNHNPVVVSSSEIRSDVKKHKKYLSKEVYRYIKDNNLYV